MPLLKSDFIHFHKSDFISKIYHFFALFWPLIKYNHSKNTPEKSYLEIRPNTLITSKSSFYRHISQSNRWIQHRFIQQCFSRTHVPKPIYYLHLIPSNMTISHSPLPKEGFFAAKSRLYSICKNLVYKPPIPPPEGATSPLPSTPSKHSRFYLKNSSCLGRSQSPFSTSKTASLQPHESDVIWSAIPHLPSCALYSRFNPTAQSPTDHSIRRSFCLSRTTPSTAKTTTQPSLLPWLRTWLLVYHDQEHPRYPTLCT